MIRHYTPFTHRCSPERCPTIGTLDARASVDACSACERGTAAYEHTCGHYAETRNPFVLRARAATLPVKVYR